MPEAFQHRVEANAMQRPSRMYSPVRPRRKGVANRFGFANWLASCQVWPPQNAFDVTTVCENIAFWYPSMARREIPLRSDMTVLPRMLLSFDDCRTRWPSCRPRAPWPSLPRRRWGALTTNDDAQRTQMAGMKPAISRRLWSANWGKLPVEHGEGE